MIEISHHGATSGATVSCHELTLTPGMKMGSDPSFSRESLEIVVNSPHAGQSDLIRFVEGLPQAPGEIRVVYGERGAEVAFRERLSRAVPRTRLLNPDS